MYKIGELSKLSKIPVKTLRFYDSEGLLRPDYIDPATGYRYYNAKKLSDCYRIVALKELGFRLGEIREIFSLPGEDFAGIIEAKWRELCELKQQTEYRLGVLANLNSMLKEDVSMFDIVVRKSDGIRLAYRRDVAENWEECGRFLQEMRDALPAEILGCRQVVIDYETEFVAGNFDVGIGVEIVGKLPKNCGFSEKILEFDCDTANLICEKEQYGDAVRVLGKYVLDHDYQIVGPVYQILYPDGTVEIKLPVVKLGDFNPEYNEDLDVPFVNDEEAVGRWKILDILPCREMFLPGKPKSAVGKEFLKELYFLPGGERYWCFGWTKGLLLTKFGYPHEKSKNPYTIEKTGGKTYMFIEWKDHKYFRGGRPEVWVFEKMDAGAYRKQEIQIEDVLPELPADDSRVLGEWTVCDFVRAVDDFNPQNLGALLPEEGLYWRSAKFLAGGAMANGFRDAPDGSVSVDAPEIWRWVRGYVICSPRRTASQYLVRGYGGVEYLFIQWKSGDYSFGGQEPGWYVFTR